LTVWREVEEALEAIILEYEKVNHLISLYQDNKARQIGLIKAGNTMGVALELGSGPGNFTKMIKTSHKGPIICLDYSDKMIFYSKKRNRFVSFIRGVFEYLPLRDETIDFVAAGYALRDSLDKPQTYRESGRVLKHKGLILLVDIGKPDNPLYQGFMAVYMKYIVPVIGGLAAGYGYRNPWSVLYDTFRKLPKNSSLRRLMKRYFATVEMEERMLGAQVIVVGRR
jgi:demethylmenaquinone methyltransferase/2-methoxy-6-polyprenyl-1,4-benzoquinol methylase